MPKSLSHPFIPILFTATLMRGIKYLYKILNGVYINLFQSQSHLSLDSQEKSHILVSRVWLQS